MKEGGWMVLLQEDVTVQTLKPSVSLRRATTHGLRAAEGVVQRGVLLQRACGVVHRDLAASEGNTRNILV